MTRDSQGTSGTYDNRSDPGTGNDDSIRGELSPDIGRLIEQTWVEMEEARDRYDRDAKRFRYWRWWFVGMFTFYTTLVGILLLKLFVGL